jgi:preprotein translocase subunit YajC
MSFRKLIAATALSAALLLPGVANAQTGLATGRTVTDTSGGEVGTITAVSGDNVTLRTDRHEVALPASSFAVTDEAVLIALTRDQLNTQVDQMLAQQQAAFVVGAVVRDSQGAEVGPVQALDAETLTIQLGEQQIRLPRNAVAAGPNGLVIGATLAELQAQISGAANTGTN